MRVLFDHNVPHKLRHFLVSYDISTADEMGWAELENGELLGSAEEAGFEVMITGDKNLSYQQNLSHRTLAIIVLSTNNWNVVKLNSEAVLNALSVAAPRSFQVVKFQ